MIVRAIGVYPGIDFSLTGIAEDTTTKRREAFGPCNL